jgi:hypothetical protein
MDVSGDQQLDLDTNLFKQRLDKDGQPMPENPQEESELPSLVEFGYCFTSTDTEAD